MNIFYFIRFYQIVCRNHSTVWNDRLCLELCFAKQCTSCSFCRIEWSYLYIIERQLTQSPLFTPEFDHRFQTFSIRFMFTYVRFSLVPQKSLNSIILQRFQHTVVHQCRTQIMPPVVSVFLTDITFQVNIGILRNNLTGQPSFYHRTSPATVDNTNWNIQYLIHHHRKVKGCCAECRSIFRITNFPASFTFVDRLQLSVLFNSSYTDSFPL